MKLKLDENLGRRQAELLRQAGHDVCTVHDQGLCAATDPQLLERCREESRCLVTLDLDFSNPMRFDPSTRPGIVVMRLPHRPAMEDLDAAVRTLVGALATRPIEGRLWVVRQGRIREYEQEDDTLE